MKRKTSDEDVLMKKDPISAPLLGIALRRRMSDFPGLTTVIKAPMML